MNFGPFRLDQVSGQLYRGSAVVPLAPKAFALLQHLASQPGRLFTKEELLESVWPGVFVGDAVLKVAIRDIRKALGDDAQAPTYIETAHRRGYRFRAEDPGNARIRRRRLLLPRFSIPRCSTRAAAA